MPIKGGPHTFADDQFEDVGAACAEGHADAHFLKALGDGEGHDAVDADGGEEEREYGEGAEDEDGEAVGDEGFADDLVHGADARHGEIGIYGTDGGGNAGGHGAGGFLLVRTPMVVLGPGALVKGEVNFSGAGGGGVAFVLHIVEDADDLPFDARRRRGGILVGDKLDDFNALGEWVEAG